MPKARRERTVEAERAAVWAMVSDPYHLPRWWPRTIRVEAVQERKYGSRARWTQVFRAKSGRDVRADFVSTHARAGEEYVWQQQLEGTAFAKLLRSSVVSLTLRDAKAGGASRTQVTIVLDQRLRGINRLGGFLARRAARRQLDEALNGLERALAPEGGNQQ